MKPTKHDYSLRGKCREKAEELARERPELRVVRGWYVCPYWGERGHWWCEEADGTVVDPTAAQFPSLGNGEYRELGETVCCSNCGSEVLLDNAVTRSNYAFCSGTCHGQFVGVL